MVWSPSSREPNLPTIKRQLTSLVVQWLKICLAMQGIAVQPLVWKDPTCLGAVETVSHNFWAHVLQLLTPHACTPQERVCVQLRPTVWDPVDYSPPGSSVHGIFPGKNTGVGCCFLLQRIVPARGSSLHLLRLYTGKRTSCPCATREAAVREAAPEKAQWRVAPVLHNGRTPACSSRAPLQPNIDQSTNISNKRANESVS